VQESGHNPDDIRHLVLTHGHIDHAGSAAEVLRRTGARTYAHAADLELITNREAERPGTTVTPGIIPAIAYLIFIKPGGTTYESLAVDQTVKDGETLPMANDIEVIHSPGHCVGHIVLLLRQEGILIAGDICSNIISLSHSVLNEDRALARKSILRVAAYPFERAVFEHGKPLDKRANQLLKERFSPMS
jgi:glyoxylase-like metal-dependent hydrolase (beta-lactamase superfamily II)